VVLGFLLRTTNINYEYKLSLTMLRKRFGSTKDKVNEQFGLLNIGELCDLYEQKEARMGETWNAYGILVEIPLRKRPPGRLRRWEGNTHMDVRTAGGRNGLEIVSSGGLWY